MALRIRMIKPLSVAYDGIRVVSYVIDQVVDDPVDQLLGFTEHYVKINEQEHLEEVRRKRVEELRQQLAGLQAQAKTVAAELAQLDPPKVDPIDVDDPPKRAIPKRPAKLAPAVIDQPPPPTTSTSTEAKA